MVLSALDGPVHVRAPGKLNLYFQVGERQEDGYHDVASVYQAVSLYEDVWASEASGFSLSVSGSVNVSGVPQDDRNLALRAARLVAQRVGYEGGVHLDIEKHVPVAGGMGGGSADAAAALVACDALWGAELGSAELHRLAAKLGADVPFALMGGTAVGTGRGDQLSPALARARFDWVIVTDEVGLSTPEVYAKLDELRETGNRIVAPAVRTPTVHPAVLKALRSGDAHALSAVTDNDLQVASIHLRTSLDDVIGTGLDHGGLTGFISGSGPTIAFLAASPEAALELQISLNAAGLVALHVHGPVRGAHLVA